MSQEFLSNSNESVSAALEEERPNDDSAVSEQDVLLLTVVASPKGVKETILTFLYRLGFAEVGDWSPVQRAANPKQVMNVLIRRRRSTQRQF